MDIITRRTADMSGRDLLLGSPDEQGGQNAILLATVNRTSIIIVCWG